MRNKKKRAYRFGIAAEYMAALWLMLKGYRIIALRYRNPKGEIDLLALKGDYLVAVEVKARHDFSQCEIAVPPAKQKQIMQTLTWLMHSPAKIAGLHLRKTPNIRFDVVWVVPWRLPRHLQDAWRV